MTSNLAQEDIDLMTHLHDSTYFVDTAKMNWFTLAQIIPKFEEGLCC